jgi:hypothetical protein
MVLFIVDPKNLSAPVVRMLSVVGSMSLEINGSHSYLLMRTKIQDTETVM